MSRIDELLSRPLPSKSNYFFEADDIDKYSDIDDQFVQADGVEPNKQYQEDDDDYGYNDDDAEDAFSGRYSSYGDDDDDVDYGASDDVGTDDISDLSALDDVDDLDDEDLADLDRELSGELDDEIGGDADEEELDSDAEMEADDMMSMAATTLLVNDELNSDEKRDFVENESDTAIREGFMTDSDVQMIIESYSEDDDDSYFSEAKYNKPMMIRLDAESKKKQLYALAINVCAAANNDADYRKLKKLMKLRKILRAKLDRKYHTQAVKRMKIYFNRLRKSKSPVLNKIADKVNK